jgi:hypothetical protein
VGVGEREKKRQAVRKVNGKHRKKILWAWALGKGDLSIYLFCHPAQIKHTAEVETLYREKIQTTSSKFNYF